MTTPEKKGGEAGHMAVNTSAQISLMADSKANLRHVRTYDKSTNIDTPMKLNFVAVTQCVVYFQNTFKKGWLNTSLYIYP